MAHTGAHSPDEDRNITLEPLAAEALRWRCDPTALGFGTTAQIEPELGVVGQETAVEALRFGIESRAPGQNVFVRGLSGTGRMTLVRRTLEQLGPQCVEGRDRCYVHNFAHPDRPRLITLARGSGRRFRRLVEEVADFVRDDLRTALATDGISARKTAIDEAAQAPIKALMQPFEESLRAAGFSLVSYQVGPVVQSAIFPVIDGRPVPPEEYQQLHEKGDVSEAEFAQMIEKREEFSNELERISRATLEVRRKHAEEVRDLIQNEARAVLTELVLPIGTAYPLLPVQRFLEELIEDVVEKQLPALHAEEEEDLTGRYRVNVLLEAAAGEACPIIVETTPTMTTLLGSIDREFGPGGVVHSDHKMIRAGSLLRADGGYLILEARDVLGEPGAWTVLMRTVRCGRLEIIPPELSSPWGIPSLKPEPMDVDIKVILLGDEQVFHALQTLDEDFTHLFKVLADFDSVMPRDDEGVRQYAGVLARVARDEGLPPFERTAVAALAEQGARIAARGNKLTARFGRLVDVAREAAFLAGKAGRDEVLGSDVEESVSRTKRRAALPSRRFRELLADGTIRVQTAGRVVGQINGLAVISAGPLTAGFPARITATIGPGTAGVINIEREAALSGAIHTKGFYILGGLLRFLLQTDHPLAFDASVAFEQSYGGIDGDSASGAEICCLLSALTAIPLRQDLAITGAIDQVGHILAVGAVNEKIEGFYDTCRDIGLTGTQGVGIPGSNAADLMLRPDVVEACRRGEFHVYAVDTVQEALTLLTGVAAGARDADGAYPEASLLGKAVTCARQYWLQAATPSPRRSRQDESELV